MAIGSVTAIGNGSILPAIWLRAFLQVPHDGLLHGRTLSCNYVLTICRQCQPIPWLHRQLFAGTEGIAGARDMA